MDLTPEEILNENNVFIRTINKVKYLEYNNRVVIRPRPEKVYQKLIDEFGITEPRLKDFK